MKTPTVLSEAAIIDEMNVATEPLPFVPAIWTDLKLSWGLPRSSIKAVIRSSPGLMPNFNAPSKSSGTLDSGIGGFLLRRGLFYLLIFRVVIHHVLLLEDHELTHYIIGDHDEYRIDELAEIFICECE